MKILKKIFSIVYFFYFACIYIVFSFFLSPFIFCLVSGEKKYTNARRIKIFWAKWMCWCIGISVQFRELAKIDYTKNYIICANHKSYLDIVLMYLIIPQDFAFLGKSELLRWPVIRIFFKRGVDIPVYRDSVSKAAKCLLFAKQEIKKGRSIVVFPEGGWDNKENEMRRFKNGAFQLAIDTQCPVLPLVFKNNYDLFTDHKNLSGNAKPGIAKVVVYSPIDTFDMSRKELVSLRDQTFQVIQKELKGEN